MEALTPAIRADAAIAINETCRGKNMLADLRSPTARIKD
jgi:hypothetical protein